MAFPVDTHVPSSCGAAFFSPERWPSQSRQSSHQEPDAFAQTLAIGRDQTDNGHARSMMPSDSRWI